MGWKTRNGMTSKALTGFKKADEVKSYNEWKEITKLRGNKR